MSGEVTGGQVFIYASYALAGITLAGLALYAFLSLQSSKKKLKMLEATSNKAD